MEREVTKEMIWSVWLTQVFGTASPVINYLLDKYKSAETAHDALIEQPDIGLGADLRRHYDNIFKYDSSSAEKVIDECIKSDIGIVLKSDSEYPQSLLDIDNPPSVLYYKGDISDINDSLPIAMVGTRDPSPYSVHTAKAIARGLCRCGFCIVSGFAVGIDIISQLSAVAAGSKTYAVLGCGLNYNYPKENLQYRNRIYEHGAFISEYPPSFAPSRITFPPRNRIISGLSLGTAVIEAGQKSGSLITANHCNNQNKPLFVVPPGDIFDLRYGGNVTLIRDGAIPLMSPRDIVYEFYPEYEDMLSREARELLISGDFINTEVYKRTGMGPGRRRLAEDPYAPVPPLPETVHKKPRKKPQKEAVPEKPKADENPVPAVSDEPASKEETAAYIDKEFVGHTADLSVLPENQRIAAEIILNMGRPVIADEIATESGMSITDTLSLLTDMELDGVISCTAGGAYIVN